MREKHPLDLLRSGEDPESKFRGNAYHWVGLYSELLRLTADAVYDLGQEHSLSEIDLAGYRALFEKRLAYWQERSRQYETAGLEARDHKRHAAG